MVMQYQGILTNVRFRRFFWGRAVSLFGSSMTPIALAFAVLQANHGSQLLGYILAAEILPNLCMLLVGGTMADRYRRDRLLVFSNVGSGLTQAGIAVVVLTAANPAWIFPLAVGNGVLGAFTSPAMRGIVPEVVDGKDAIKQANSLLNAVRSAARIIGPSAAGGLVATIGGGYGIAIDAASFFVAAIFLGQVSIPSHPVVQHRSIAIDVRDGWTYFHQRRWIWSVTAAFSVMNAVQMGVWQVLGPIIAKHAFGSTAWGLTLGIKSVGLLMASLFMLRFELNRPLRNCMLSIAMSGLPMIVLGQAYGLPYLFIASLLAGVGSAISGIAWDTTLQRAIPQDKLARVCAIDDFGSFMTIPIGEILAVPVADTFGTHIVATVGGAVFIVAALLPLSERLVRQTTKEDIQALRL